jgi:Tfp pilus assembly protein PilF
MEDRIESIKEFLKSNPNDSFLQHALALEYIKLGNTAAARQLFETVLTREPGYIGSYYHLAGLLARTGETELAVDWYQKGMKAAKAAGENRAYNELKAAWEELVF